MITRSKLAEQLREYQTRSKHDWASFSLFSSTSNLASSRVDVAIFVIWELVILAFVVFSIVSLYYRHSRLALSILWKLFSRESTLVDFPEELLSGP
ncbi:hypothetical protein AAHA92_33056 [Salvia divinorum]|uniref:Uncharacterized protein n=1 Tax=Salvia divinorum TaxID=28513 RepID=A0ABD1FMQ3_SALDI